MSKHKTDVTNSLKNYCTTANCSTYRTNITTSMGRINVYVGSDSKLHFVNSGGADTALPFNGSGIGLDGKIHHNGISFYPIFGKKCTMVSHPGSGSIRFKYQNLPVSFEAEARALGYTEPTQLTSAMFKMSFDKSNMDSFTIGAVNIPEIDGPAIACVAQYLNNWTARGTISYDGYHPSAGEAGAGSYYGMRETYIWFCPSMQWSC